MAVQNLLRGVIARRRRRERPWVGPARIAGPKQDPDRRPTVRGCSTEDARPVQRSRSPGWPPTWPTPATWRRPRLRRVLLVLCWVLAVGCVTHALIEDAQRVLSLAGALQIRYPASLWETVNRHTADIQDLAFNETWFLIEGLLWGMLALIVLGASSARRWWTGTALAAIAVLTAIGLLSAFDVIGNIIIF